MRKQLLGALLAGTALLAACGSDDDSSESTSPPPATGATADAPSTDAPATAAIVSVATIDVGEVLVDEGGLTLYGFTTDADGLPTCNDGCATAWPPVIVESADLPAGLDAAVFSVVERDDGTFQLKAGKWPLYLFAGDAAPGEANGQGSGGVWFVAAGDGSLIKS